MFHSATLRLTLWYLAIVMFISLLFSMAVYRSSTAELGNSLHRQAIVLRQMPRFAVPVDFDLEQFQQQQYDLATSKIQTSLLMLNLIILVLAGGASYLLARRTLLPIENALEAQSRFTADASHELRTPLTAMKTEIEVALRGKDLDQKEVKELLGSNLEEIAKLETLSTSLLRLAQHDNAQGKDDELCSVADLVTTSVGRMQKMADHKQIQLDTKLKDFEVLGDKASLEELIIILLDNAIKYSPASSRIVVSSTKKGDSGSIEVTDHGVGIGEADQAHIFDRFYRSDSSRTKSSTNGYGLGLSIAQQIVGLHKGTVKVKSVIGEGSTFSVVLPVAKP